MSWSSGVFSRVRNWVNDKNAAIKILASLHDEEDDNLAAGINACLHKGGQNSPTANIPMGGYRFTGAGDGVAAQDFSTLAQMQLPAAATGACTGTANTYAVTISPSIAVLQAGMVLRLTFPANNTGASTVDVNEIGAKQLNSSQGNALWRNAVTTAGLYYCYYNGTAFYVLNPNRKFSGVHLWEDPMSTLTSNTPVTYAFTAAELYDTDAYHSVSTDTTRIIIPAGINYVRLFAKAHITQSVAAAADAYTRLVIKAGGTAPRSYAMRDNFGAISGASAHYLQVITPVIACTSSFYYELEILQYSGANMTLESIEFSAEAILE